jgi:NAD(P)-dependent dehydrogenase (short-subunit alcohol dehydrogenase family)
VLKLSSKVNECKPLGVGRLAQINFLGPAMLTRLLERPLLAAAAETGVANIVHVSSVTHRYAVRRGTRHGI